MVSKRDEKYVVYPVYFESRAPRPLRRVPKPLSVKGPSADEIARAALALKLSPVLEKGRAHPSRPWEHSGRVLIDMRGEKATLLRQLAEQMLAQRGKAGNVPARRA